MAAAVGEMDGNVHKVMQFHKLLQVTGIGDDVHNDDAHKMDDNDVGSVVDPNTEDVVHTRDGDVDGDDVAYKELWEEVDDGHGGMVVAEHTLLMPDADVGHYAEDYYYCDTHCKMEEEEEDCFAAENETS